MYIITKFSNVTNDDLGTELYYFENRLPYKKGCKYPKDISSIIFFSSYGSCYTNLQKSLIYYIPYQHLQHLLKGVFLWKAVYIQLEETD